MPALSGALEPINLRSTTHYAVLAGSLVSDIPASAIVGDVGLSPAAGSKITGFGAEEVTGKMYSVDASGPAGSIAAATELTAAKSDLTTAYNDAAGRTPVPTGRFLNPGAGEIGGMVLAPGLYKSTGDLFITGSDLTLMGGPSDVWIFQIATLLNVGNGIQVKLAGGASASNVFWQVGSSAMLGTTSVFAGTLMADQSIVMKTGASMTGRALARIAAVTLASNRITVPSPNAVPLLPAQAARDFGFVPSDPYQGLRFRVPADGKAKLELFDPQGRVAAVLFDGQASGSVGNQADGPPRGLPPGLYIAKLKSLGKYTLAKILVMN